LAVGLNWRVERVLSTMKRAPLATVSRFLEHSVSASNVALYWYCAAKVFHHQFLGRAETAEKLHGFQMHEAVAKESLKKLGPLLKIPMPRTVSALIGGMQAQVSSALKRRLILANTRERITFMAIVPELRCFGVPDEIDCRSGKHPVVVERKYVKRIPEKPWLDHCVQVGVYMKGLAVLGFRQPYGILMYIAPDSEKRFRVELDETLNKQIQTAASQAMELIRRHAEPRPTSNPNKCCVCEYRVLCKWRADFPNYPSPYIVDIETDMQGHCIWGITAYSSKDAELRQFFAERPSRERGIVSDFISYVNENPEAAILSFSGSNYDSRILRDRMEHLRLCENLDDRRFVDMCGHLRQAGLRGTLTEISEPFYRFRHVHLKKGAAWICYRRFLRTKKKGSRSRLKRILFEYMADDVLGLIKICLGCPDPFDKAARLVLRPLDFGKTKYLRAAYLRLGKAIRRDRSDRRQDIEVRLRSSNTRELEHIVEALNSTGFISKISQDKNAYAVRLYGFRAEAFLKMIGQLT